MTVCQPRRKLSSISTLEYLPVGSKHHTFSDCQQRLWWPEPRAKFSDHVGSVTEITGTMNV